MVEPRRWRLCHLGDLGQHLALGSLHRVALQTFFVESMLIVWASPSTGHAGAGKGQTGVDKKVFFFDGQVCVTCRGI